MFWYVNRNAGALVNGKGASGGGGYLFICLYVCVYFSEFITSCYLVNCVLLNDEIS